MSILDEVNHRPESRMRETRQSGSEGGGAEINRLSLPLCAPESAQSQRGESPLQVDALRPVTDCNCIRPRGGVGSSRR